MTRQMRLTFWLMTLPASFVIGGLILFAIANWILSSLGLLGSNALTVTISIIFYAFISLGILAFIPGSIALLILVGRPQFRKK